MPQFSQFRARDLVKIALKLGFKLRAQSGSHAVYVHPDGRRTSIPIHPTQVIGVGLFTKIIKKDLKISKQEVIKILKD